MHSKLIGAILLIASTTLGAGALILPIMSANYGFFIGTVICILTWILLTYSSLLIVELNLWLPEKTNLVSISRVCLGKYAPWFIWIFYLLLFYTVLAIYFTAISSITIDLVQDYFHITLTRGSTLLVYLAILILIIYLGVRILDTVNRILIFLMFLSFLLIIIGALSIVEPTRLLHINMFHQGSLLLIAVAAFGYQFIIPVLRDFLGSDLHKLRLAIIWGSIIPLIFYIIAIVFILSSLSLTELRTIIVLPEPSTALAACLAFESQHYWIDMAFRWFAYFAIISSLLSLTFGAMSFFMDGFRSKHLRFAKPISIVTMFLPPTLYVYFFRYNYLPSMKYGGLVTLILYVIVPVLMIWWGRYRKNLAFGYRVKGGKFALTIMLICSSVIIFSGW